MTKVQSQEHEWNLQDLFINDDDPAIEEARSEFQETTKAFVQKWESRNDYLTNIKALEEAMTDYEAWVTNFSVPKDYFYFWLRTSQEQDNPVLKAKFGKSEQIYRSTIKEIQFFDLRLAKVSEEMQKEILANDNLAYFRHYFEKLFASAKHQLGEEAEQVMLLQSKSAYSAWVDMTSEFLGKEEVELADEDGKVAKRSYAEVSSMISSKNKQVRDAAAVALNTILLKHVDVAEAEMNAVLDNKLAKDTLRKFPRPDSSRHLGDDVSTSVVDTMLEVVEANFDISQDFYKLKAKLLGAEKLAYHERNVPIGEEHIKYTYAEAEDLLLKVLGNLDSELAEKAKFLLDQGRVDVFPRKGKRSGAFCAYFGKGLPTYLMLNHTDKLNDVLTLAHEMGHALNAELMRVQNGLNFDTPMSTAEVASTFVEDFVLQELLKHASKEQRLVLLMEKLNDDISTISRQVACYRFEQQLHNEYREKAFLSKDEIGAAFLKNMGAYLGDAVELSPGSENWWVYWSHIRSYFYVYSYASGLLISKAMQAAVHKDPQFIKSVKVFLASGGSAAPEVLFSQMGININQREFWQSGMDEIRSLLNEVSSLV